jgi:hypothetical protein
LPEAPTRSAHEVNELYGYHPWKADLCDFPGQDGSEPARLRESPGQSSDVEQAQGLGFTEVITWLGFVYVALVIDTFARCVSY